MPRFALLLLLVLVVAAAAGVEADGEVLVNEDAEVATGEDGDDYEVEAEDAEDGGGPEPGAGPPVVETHAGKISGKVLTSAGGRKYLAFLGVPYAQPPVGSLRFKFPRRLKENAWRGVRRCDRDAPRCPQLTYPERQFDGDEDCLYLNVYTHRLEDTRSVPVDELVERLRPVLVWLHGGNFQHGSGSFDDVGPERFMDNEEDVVLVVPNYRLGALGYLSVGEHPAVGNAGMKDVFSVLSWVHGHVASFGGHPGKVTLGGHQAGGAAAHLHALSPLSSGEPDLFLQTFSMSGTALAPWAVLPAAEATRRAVRLGRQLGCLKKRAGDDDDVARAVLPDLVRCLRSKSAEAVVRASEEVLDWPSDLAFPFVPSVERFDGHNRPFMIASPGETLRAGAGAHKTWVTGVTTHDGLPMALQTMVLGGALRDLNERFEDAVWEYLGLDHARAALAAGPAWRRAAGRRLRDHYLPGNQSIALITLSGLIDLTSDALYCQSLHEAVALQSSAKRAGPVLVYRFGFDRHKDRTRVLGVPLGTDVELMFPAIFANEKSNLTKEEKSMSRKMLRFLTNFVTSEDPTPEKEELLDNFLWPPAKRENFSFLDIGSKGQFSEATNFYTEGIAMWDQIFEELGNKLTDTDHKKPTKKEETDKEDTSNRDEL